MPDNTLNISFIRHYTVPYYKSTARLKGKKKMSHDNDD